MSAHPHPLEPLGADELERAVACVRASRELDGAARFVCVELREPDKAQIAAWRAGGPLPPREAALVVLDGGRTHEAIVTLADGALVAWEHVPDVQAAITADEYVEAEEAVKADPAFRQALEQRGVRELDLVMVDTWSVGRFEEPGRRVGRALAWLRSDLTGDNGYARPIGGLLALVDLDSMQVVRIDDHGALPVPEGARRLPQRWRPPVPGRPAADRGRATRGLQPRARRPRAQVGAVAPARRLQPARIADAARARVRRRRRRGATADRAPALDRRAGDPYADTNPTVVFKNAFDIGEYGIGPYANSLALGCDCLGEIRYLDALVHDSRGRAQTIETPSACTRRTRASSGSTSTGAAA